MDVDEWLFSRSKRARGSTHREFAAHIVSTLVGTGHDEAVARCEMGLREFEDAITASATRQASLAAAKSPDTPEGLHTAKQQLMRAVHFLAARCRRERSKAEEAEELRAQLVESQARVAEGERLNAFLQECLRVQLKASSSAPSANWGTA